MNKENYFYKKTFTILLSLYAPTVRKTHCLLANTTKKEQSHYRYENRPIFLIDFHAVNSLV